ncbi:MAG: hypothetical protein DWB45_13890, partial [Xanthomonadales bacterium]|nr:hypothetical protein [Xanthomonadales bacterium]
MLARSPNLRRAALILVLVLIAAVGAAWLVLRASLPRLDGELHGSGLRLPTRLERDALGTVTIHAGSRTDAAWTLGFVHAQERWFGMDLARRSAAGELAELFGAVAVPADRRARAHRMRQRLREACANLPERQRALIDAYKASRHYQTKRPATKKGYDHLLAALIRWAGDTPIAAITAPRVQVLYESLYDRTPGRANHLITMLRTVMAYAVRMGKLPTNPVSKPRLMGNRPRHQVWPESGMEAAVRAADAMGYHSLGTAVMMAFFLAQRPTDVREMTRASYRDGKFIFRQSKTGAAVDVPAVAELQRRIAAELARHDHLTILICETTGRPWTEDNLSHV